MVLVHGQQEGLIKQIVSIKIRHLIKPGQDQRIKSSFVEGPDQVRGLLFVQEKIHLWQTADQRRHDVRQ